jgi:pSer/pThr/pTyr-binding forkhead associated (FHA) protein
VGGDVALGIQAIIEVAKDDQVVIRRTAAAGNVKVNGIPLGDPTPLIHGDKVEVGGQELMYSDDKKVGATQFVSAGDIAAVASKRGGPARATAATGGRLVSLVDGKEYTIPAAGVTIGRDASSDVVVAQNEVSRKHAELVPVADGYELRDLSANGVWVNGNRIQKSQVLSRADVIRVGTEELRFYADVNAAAGATPPAGAKPVTPPSGAAVPKAPATPAKPAVDSRPIYAVLEVMNGVTKGTQHTLRVPLAHVGRGAHNDIAVDDDSVSDSHAKLQRRDDGWYVVDMDSTNGTYVGGQRIAGERKLEGAPDLRFGGVKMIFRPKDMAADQGKGTRAIAPVDRSKLARPTQQTAPLPATPPASAAAPTPETAKGGVPMWVWIVVVLAIVAAIAVFMMKR